MGGPTIIHWFRKGLRLHDNPALLSALEKVFEIELSQVNILNVKKESVDFPVQFMNKTVFPVIIRRIELLVLNVSRNEKMTCNFITNKT